MNLPLYQGPQLQPAHTPQGSSPVENPFAGAFQKSAAALTEAARNREQAIQERREYILEQKRSAALSDAVNQMNTEIIERLMLDDGVGNSFYDKDGLLIKDEVEEIKQRYLAVADAWTSGFSSEQGMLAASKAQQQYRQAIPEAIDAKLMAGLKTRADRARSNNIRAAISRRDYAGAERISQEALDKGLISEAEHQNMVNDIEKDRATYEIDFASTPNDIKDWLRNPANQEVITRNPKIAAYAQRTMDAMLRAQATQQRNAYKQQIDEQLLDVEQQLLDLEELEAAYNENPEKTTKSELVGRLDAMEPNAAFPDTLPAAPVLASPIVRKVFQDYKGDFSSPQAKIAAFSALCSEAAVTPNIDDPIAVKELELLAASMGLTNQDAARAIKSYKDSIGPNATTFNPTKVSADILKLHKARNKQIVDFIGNQMSFVGKSNFKSLYNEDTAVISYSLTKATHDFYTWYQQNPDATMDEQVNKFNAYYHNTLTDQQTADVALANADAFTVYAQYLTAYGEQRINKNEYDKKIKERRDELEKAFNAEIDARIKKVGIDQAIAQYPIQAAEMRSTLSAALNRQKDLSFSIDASTPANPYVLPGYTDEYILYVPADNSPTNLQHIIAEAKDGQYTAVRVVPVDSLKSAVASEALQKRCQKVYGQKFNKINFTNNILSFHKETSEEVEFKDAHPEEASKKARLEIRKKERQTAKRYFTPTEQEEETEYEEDSPLRREANLFPEDGIVSEELY